MRTSTRLFFLVVALQLSLSAFATETFSGKVVRVLDGDTMVVLVGGHDQVMVRLAHIDAPEKAQPFGQQAKQALADLAFSKEVGCELSGLDRYRRTIAVCMVNGTVMNLELVKLGMAWVYRKYAHGVPEYYSAEVEAHRLGLGLWTDTSPVSPWEWRHMQAASHARQQ